MRLNEYTKGFKYRMRRFFCQYQVLFYAVGIDLLNASTMLPVPGAPIVKDAGALIYRGYSCRQLLRV